LYASIEFIFVNLAKGQNIAIEFARNKGDFALGISVKMDADAIRTLK
jgi:hypothetical protein